MPEAAAVPWAVVVDESAILLVIVVALVAFLLTVELLALLTLLGHVVDEAESAHAATQGVGQSGRVLLNG